MNPGRSIKQRASLCVNADPFSLLDLGLAYLFVRLGVLVASWQSTSATKAPRHQAVTKKPLHFDFRHLRLLVRMLFLRQPNRPVGRRLIYSRIKTTLEEAYEKV